MRAAATWAERFAMLDALFAARAGLDLGLRPEGLRPGASPAIRSRTGPMDTGDLIAPEVRYAWRTLLTSRGAVPVAELARETGWSARHLDNRFRAEIGLTPKAVGRVIRFDRARRLLMRRAWS